MNLSFHRKNLCAVLRETGTSYVVLGEQSACDGGLLEREEYAVNLDRTILLIRPTNLGWESIHAFEQTLSKKELAPVDQKEAWPWSGETSLLKDVYQHWHKTYGVPEKTVRGWSKKYHWTEDSSGKALTCANEKSKVVSKQRVLKMLGTVSKYSARNPKSKK